LQALGLDREYDFEMGWFYIESRAEIGSLEVISGVTVEPRGKDYVRRSHFGLHEGRMRSLSGDRRSAFFTAPVGRSPAAHH
jgi:hypothetical protein